ncbi:hypothetical protein PMZ80_009046 [Knufia obscura]|uniref:Uncharacterized protein n=1 Tax=Knufia obscura TaxID=1635080 RepID=A0ABR0RF72_9EURO|nr:hypothetical protein PMZ80_009046 [Knufia obscura]
MANISSQLLRDDRSARKISAIYDEAVTAKTWQWHKKNRKDKASKQLSKAKDDKQVQAANQHIKSTKINARSAKGHTKPAVTRSLTPDSLPDLVYSDNGM